MPAHYRQAVLDKLREPEHAEKYSEEHQKLTDVGDAGFDDLVLDLFPPKTVFGQEVCAVAGLHYDLKDEALDPPKVEDQVGEEDLAPEPTTGPDEGPAPEPEPEPNKPVAKKSKKQ